MGGGGGHGHPRTPLATPLNKNKIVACGLFLLSTRFPRSHLLPTLLGCNGHGKKKDPGNELEEGTQPVLLFNKL